MALATTNDATNGDVLITGASSGIGLELARVFAGEGHDLILVAEHGVALKEAADELLAMAPGLRIEAIVADLRRDDSARQIYEQVRASGRFVDILVNNAGVGVWGPFPETPLAEELAMVRLNVDAVIRLTKHFVAPMIERGFGRILITASQAAVMPTALAAVYAGTKAFDYAFALALREELKDSGVTVTALLPGATDTGWFDRAGAGHTETAQGDLADPAAVARAGYEALMAGDDHVVTPFKDRLAVTAAKMMPARSAVTRLE